MLQNELMSGRLWVCFVFIFHQLIPGEVKIHTPGKRTELGRLEAKSWCQIKTFLLPTEPVISGGNADTGYSLLDNLAGFLLPWLPGSSQECQASPQDNWSQTCLSFCSSFHSLAVLNKRDKWGIHHHSLEFHPCRTSAQQQSSEVVKEV